MSDTLDGETMSDKGGKRREEADRKRPKLRLAKSVGKENTEEETIKKSALADMIQKNADMTDDPERRYEKRRTVLWPACLLVGRHEFQCQIWNLSIGGARIRCDIPLRAGAPVALKLPGRDQLDAHIAWGEADSLGLSFSDEPERVRAVLSDRLAILGLEPEDIDG